MATAKTKKQVENSRGIASLLPIVQWLPNYERAWLRPDVIAGLTVAALVVPKSLGYAGIAGVPIQYGLYAAAAGAILYALFGTSRQIATGPSSALAAVAAGAVVTAGAAAGSEDAVALVAAIGIALSIGWLLYVSAAPHMPVLGRQPGKQVFRSIEEYPDSETYPGLLVLRFDTGLFFASADALEDRVRELALQADPPLHTVVIDFEGINFIDSQGSGKVAELVELATNYDIELRLTRVKQKVKDVLRLDGVIDSLGKSQIYGNVYEAAADQIPDRQTS